ncbi:MAG: Amt family ammonium transporter [Lentimonas sp.]|jgi:Amt family ammonium transporter
MKNTYRLICLLLLSIAPGFLLAQEAELTEMTEQVVEATATVDSGDTAWMIVATALVLLMTLPGLALFYGGLVRSKNVLSILVQCFAMAGVMSLLWVIYGYSLAFSDGGAWQTYLGGFDYLFLKHMTVDSVSGTIPESVFVTFQMTFAIITPALIIGAFAERIKFSAVLLFSILWFTFSYLPICHMAWGGEGALFHHWGVIDFAGGTVVHINAGVAGLVTCIMLGKRRGYPGPQMRPHNLPFAVMGAGMLWVGWFGFNAGSELAADGTAGMAMLVTQISTAAGATVWMLIEMLKYGKPSALGVATGAVAGLVAITPACGVTGPLGAILLGAVSAVTCFIMATKLKQKFGFDDSLDVFCVHGIGGIVGAVLTGLTAAGFMGGVGLDGVSVGSQMWAQSKSVFVTIGWSAVVSVVAFFIVDKLVGGARVSDESETTGLDLSEHDEQAYHIL